MQKLPEVKNKLYCAEYQIQNIEARLTNWAYN